MIEERIRLLRRLVADKSATHAALRVFCFCLTQGEPMSISNNQLAREVGLNNRTVHDGKMLLLEKGYITCEVSQAARAGRYATFKYRIADTQPKCSNCSTPLVRAVENGLCCNCEPAMGGSL